jgi:hypothetical protein
VTPEQFIAGAVKVYGRKKWKPKLAADLGVDVSTIHRIVKRDQIPGPYEVALRGLMAHRSQEVLLEKAARKLLPRKFRKRTTPRKPKTKPAEPTGGTT